MAEQPPADWTDDAFLGGAFQAWQPRSGYRAGLDALLLAAATPPSERFLEAGCGAGVAMLAIAHWQPRAHGVGVERLAWLAELAQRNCARSAMSDRLAVVSGDVLDPSMPLGGFDVIACNPPFDDGRLGRPPAPNKQHSHRTEHPLDVWVRRLADRLTGGGRLVMIHRADQLSTLLAAFEGRLGGIQARPLHPHLGQSASRILVFAVKGSRAPLRLLPGLTLHEADGGYTAPVDAALRGREPLGWA